MSIVAVFDPVRINIGISDIFHLLEEGFSFFLELWIGAICSPDCFGKLKEILTSIGSWSTLLRGVEFPFIVPFDIPNNAGLFLYWVVTEFSLVRQSPSIELNLFGHVIHVDCSIPEEASGLPVPILRSLDIIIIVPDTHSTFLLHHVPYEARSLISHHNNVGIASNAGETLEMVFSNGHVVGAVD